VTELRVKPAERDVLRFPGSHGNGESHDAAEAHDDARLLVAIARGEPQALAALYDQRGGLLYSLLVRILVSEMEAQEVMQDTFVQIWRRAGEYNPARSSPMSWMIMIARGLALDRLRSRARRTARYSAYQQEIASFLIEEVDGANQMERGELAGACAAALRRLPEAQGRALQLAFLRGWTHEEIASAEREPLGTIKTRIRRGLLALRQVLKDYHG